MRTRGQSRSDPTHVKQLIEFLKHLPLLVDQDVAAESGALLVALIELMHVAESGQDFLHLNGACEHHRERVPASLHHADEDFTVQPCVCGELREGRSDLRAVPDFL